MAEPIAPRPALSRRLGTAACRESAYGSLCVYVALATLPCVRCAKPIPSGAWFTRQALQEPVCRGCRDFAPTAFDPGAGLPLCRMERLDPACRAALATHRSERSYLAEVEAARGRPRLQRARGPAYPADRPEAWRTVPVPAVSQPRGLTARRNAVRP